MAFGTSSFMMISGLFEITRPLSVVLAIVISGFICILISASVAELASMYPSSPGVRTYLKVAFDNRLSLTLVYLYLIFMVLIAGVESYMFALVTKAIWPGLSTIVIVWALLAFTIVVNLLGLELPRGLQIISTILLLLCVLALGTYGLIQAPATASPATAAQGLEQFKLLPAAIIMAIFLFTGFEWVTMLGFSPKSYERRIPMAMPLAIITLILTYGVLALGFSSQMPVESIAATPTPQISYFSRLLGNGGGYVAWAISVLAIFSTFNAGIMGGGRLIYVLTREGNLPKWCGKMSLRTGAPIGGIIVLGSLAAISSMLILTYELHLLAAIVGSAIVSFVYAAFLLAVVVLRKKQPKARRTYRTPLAPWLQWIMILALPVLGLLSLFSQVNMQYQPAITLGAFIIFAAGLARWSILRTRR